MKEIGENKLNPKESLFIKYYTDIKDKSTFGNGTLSAMKVWPGQSYHSARVTASRVLTKTKIQIGQLLEHKGLSSGKLVEKIGEWIDAKKISTSLTEPDKITDDYQTQLKAGEMLIKLLVLESPQQANIQVNVLNNLTEDRAKFGI